MRHGPSSGGDWADEADPTMAVRPTASATARTRRLRPHSLVPIWPPSRSDVSGGWGVPALLPRRSGRRWRRQLVEEGVDDREAAAAQLPCIADGVVVDEAGGVRLDAEGG